MSSIATIIAGFLLCSALIIFSGARLSKYGDIIADLTGMGKAWLGLILMAAITSLPELVTGVSAIVIIDVPDIAVGDIMGSCAFNLLILAVIDYFVPGKPLSSVVTKNHAVAGFIGIFLLALAVISIVFPTLFPVLIWFSASSLLMLITYLVSVRIMFRNEKRHPVQPVNRSLVTPAEKKGISLSAAIRRYVFFALVVVASAVALPHFADELASATGLNDSFVGTLLVAATTSMPELVVSIAAVRIGSVDIAVGNLLGSNIFNMVILALDDLMYAGGSIFTRIDSAHALSGLVALLMTAVAGISILYSTPQKRLVLGIDAIILVALYFFLIIALYSMG